MTAIFGDQSRTLRAPRDGWNRTFVMGSPHHFMRGCAFARCGSALSSTVRVDPQDEPDGNLPPDQRKPGCPHCRRLLAAGLSGHSR